VAGGLAQREEAHLAVVVHHAVVELAAPEVEDPERLERHRHAPVRVGRVLRNQPIGERREGGDCTSHVCGERERPAEAGVGADVLAERGISRKGRGRGAGRVDLAGEHRLLGTADGGEVVRVDRDVERQQVGVGGRKGGPRPDPRSLLTVLGLAEQRGRRVDELGHERASRCGAGDRLAGTKPLELGGESRVDVGERNATHGSGAGDVQLGDQETGLQASLHVLDRPGRVDEHELGRGRLRLAGRRRRRPRENAETQSTRDGDGRADQGGAVLT
jgi:hypothetical protein